jgi:hypothetical protein
MRPPRALRLAYPSSASPFDEILEEPAAGSPDSTPPGVGE